MSKFSIGSRVVKPESGNHGTVVEVMPPRRGRQLYKVSWEGYISDELEVNLIPDCDIADPYERCINGIFGSYSDFSKKNTTFKIKSKNNSTISSLKASKTLFRAYQFKPLLKFLNSPNRRLLVADEVGLGKTIEAGHIMLELKARKELQHVLIVCPKSLQKKWKDELSFKFGLSFKIYETQKDLINDMADSRVPVRAIVNYEKIRMRKKEEENKPSKKYPANLVDFLQESSFKFSLVLCDEAHKMRNKTTQTFRGAEVVMDRTNAAVFLTATPVMISTENLYNLLHLLDSTRYYNYQIFENRLQENRPFVEALTDLNNNVPLSHIAGQLESAKIVTRFAINEITVMEKETTIGETFAEDPLYQEIISLLNSDDTHKNRARLQCLISSMSVMNTVFSRTRKRDVTRDLSQAERKPHPRKIILNEEERRFFDEVIEQYVDDNSYTDEWGEEVMTPGGALGLVQKKRQVASSVFAYMNTEDNLDQGIDLYEGFEDAKFDELIKIIDEVFKHGTKKIVVFALFRKTLKYLKLRLNKRGLGCLIIHGQVDNRADILDEFKNNDNAHILLSSEVGSEGLDMQFCNSMVNYDLPWNPMVVEQRIGRIDRFGQKSPVVNIYNMIVSDSIQEDIYVRLLDRIGIFRGTIGDMEAILDAPLEKGGSHTIQEVYNNLERELFISRLTEEERRVKIAQVERAIANEEENIQHLKEGLNNALTNDAYFQDEINRMLAINSYVTEVELRNYLESVIRVEMPTCSLASVGDGIYRFSISVSTPRVLQNFLTQYQPLGDENDILFNRFKREIDDKQEFLLTFNQQKAYDNSKMMYLNIYHPIIQACLNYFQRKDKISQNSFSYALDADDLLRSGKSYYMAVYKIAVCRKVLGVLKTTETLYPLVFDVNERAAMSDASLTDRIFARSQVAGKESNLTQLATDSEMIQDMRYDFAELLNVEKSRRLQEIRKQVESDRNRNIQQTEEYYDVRITKLNNEIKGYELSLQYGFLDAKERRGVEGALRLRKSDLQTEAREKAEKIAQLKEDSLITIEDEIISLNYISIL